MDSPYCQQLHQLKPGPKTPTIDLAYAVLLSEFEAMRRHEPVAREGANIEGVHQMRVATRRGRAAFRAFKEALPKKPIVAFNREFKWVAGALGEVRDLDVYRANVHRYADQIPAADAEHLIGYHEYLQLQWQVARKQLLACLDSPRYARLVEDFTGFIEKGPSSATRRKTGAVQSVARPMLVKRLTRVRRDGGAISEASPDEDLHALRIQCKRLRYLFEFFVPVYGKKLKVNVPPLKSLQDVLGDFQDACVATERLHAYADRVVMRAKNRGQLIALGQLIHSQRDAASKKRDEFGKIWDRFDRKVTIAGVKGLN
ncbi:MAG: CHAD domain-containing protein [Planctomycetota bacterium]|jgi:CHAD domain-containing protein